MPDKPTDKEIVKALEDTLCRIKGAEHLIVPKEGVENLCNGLENALNYINRQEARIGVYETCNARKDEAIKHLESEVKRLQAENERLKELIEVRHKVFETKCEELETAKAENRRLTAKNLLLEHNSTNIVSASCLYELEKQKERAERYKEKWIAETKAEAYKEFAERLKDMSEHFWEEKENFVSEEQIDNLLKELVGEDNAKEKE